MQNRYLAGVAVFFLVVSLRHFLTVCTALIHSKYTAFSVAVAYGG